MWRYPLLNCFFIVSLHYTYCCYCNQQHGLVNAKGETGAGYKRHLDFEEYSGSDFDIENSSKRDSDVAGIFNETFSVDNYTVIQIDNGTNLSTPPTEDVIITTSLPNNITDTGALDKITRTSTSIVFTSTRETEIAETNSTTDIRLSNETSVITKINETSVANEVNESSAINEINETSVANNINESSGTNETNASNEINEKNTTNELNETISSNEINDTNASNETNETSTSNEINETSSPNTIRMMHTSLESDIEIPIPQINITHLIPNEPLYTELNMGTQEEVSMYCNKYKNTGPLDINKMADIWRIAYYTMPQKLKCFKLHIKLLTADDRQYYSKVYGNFNNRINWGKCELEIMSRDHNNNFTNRRHFLQSVESVSGVMKNIIIEEEISAKVSSVSLVEEIPDQWLVVKNLLLMRDCITGELAIFTRVPMEPKMIDIEDALSQFGEPSILNGTRACLYNT